MFSELLCLWTGFSIYLVSYFGLLSTTVLFTIFSTTARVIHSYNCLDEGKVRVKKFESGVPAKAIWDRQPSTRQRKLPAGRLKRARVPETRGALDGCKRARVPETRGGSATGDARAKVKSHHSIAATRSGLASLAHFAAFTLAARSAFVSEKPCHEHSLPSLLVRHMWYVSDSRPPSLVSVHLQ